MPDMAVVKMTDDESREFRKALHAALMGYISETCHQMQTSSLSVVNLTIGELAGSLSQLDYQATRDMIVAIGDCLDPDAGDAEKAEADERRFDAVMRLAKAFDLSIAEHEGMMS